MTMSLDLTDLTKVVSIPLPTLLAEEVAVTSSGAMASIVVGVITGVLGFSWKCIVTGITLTEDLAGGLNQ